MTIYFVFLRGVNLGKRTVKSADLQKAFQDMGYADAQTLIASGNVMFSAHQLPNINDVETALAHAFGFSIGVVVRTLDQMVELVASMPFGTYEKNEETKLYAAFLSKPMGDEIADLGSIVGDFELTRIDTDQYFAAAFRLPNGRFGTGLDQFDKRFKNSTVTQRNWNTILRMIDKAQTLEKKKK